MDLRGKTALVTGAAAGIGAGIARVLSGHGANLALCDVQTKLADVATAIGQAAPAGRDSVLHRQADVRSAAAVKAFVDAAVSRFGRLDLVVANAGIWRPTDPIADDWDKAQADWALIVETNLRGVFFTGRATIPHLVKSAPSNLVIVATDHICPPPGFALGGGTRMDVYDASKFGLNGLTQAWSKRLRPESVRVNALCMDATDSEMVRYASGDRATPEVIAKWMRPEQIANLMLELIDEGPSGRTGENIGIWMDHPIVLPPRREVLPSRHP